MSVNVSEGRIRELVEAAGGREAIVDGERQFRADRRYVDENREYFKQRYPDQWVGVMQRQVVAHGDSADSIVAALREAHHDIGRAVLHHAAVEESTWLLAQGSRCAA